MIKLSQRLGLQSKKRPLRLEQMDDDLKNSIWNVLSYTYFTDCSREFDYGGEARGFIQTLWINHFKLPIDTIPPIWTLTYKPLREYYFKAKWYEIYEFIEFIANCSFFKDKHSDFIVYCNNVFEKELAPVRFVGGQITPITDPIEVSEIETSLNGPFEGANHHLATALKHLSDTKSPDYRNSIKESISAVEQILRTITGEKTLGKALDKAQGLVNIDSQLKAGFEKLYSYTNSGGGMRHARMNDAPVEFEEAKFMLVACSAFSNYITAKASKTGLL